MSLEVRELTPHGSGAISVLRLAGERAEAAFRELGGKVRLERGVPVLVRLRWEGEDLDEAIACLRSPTEIELHVHGSPALVRRLVDHLGHLGAPVVSPSGSRSIEARAAEMLARAPSEGAARILLDQAEGALTRELRSLASMSEAPRERAIDALLEGRRIARWAIEPAEVVLAGPVNAGKSTLFNALLGERRAIADPEPGTTRDLLRERALLGSWPAWISDTAGERFQVAPGDAGAVETAGLERGRRARAGADVVLWLEPCGPKATPRRSPIGIPTEIVSTFADLCPDAPPLGAVSALRDPEAARARVAEIFRRSLRLPDDPWTRGAGVPFTADLADRIESLRGRSGAEIARHLEALIAGEAPIL